SISGHNDASPRVSVLFRPFKDDRTIVRAGAGLFYDRSPLQSRYFELASLNDDDELLDDSGLAINSHTRFPGRVGTASALGGSTIIDGPRAFMNVMSTSF